MSPTQKRTHADPKRLLSNARYRIELDAVTGISLKEMDSAHDTAGLVRVMSAWADNPDLRGPLDEEDLLVVALAQDLPHAFEVWLNMGSPLNADTLLALMECEASSFVFRDNDQIIHFLTPSLASWRGPLFSHLVCFAKSTQALALKMLDMGLIEVDTPVPVSSDDARAWLWFQDPLIKCMDDATFPLHVALKSKRWETAHYLQRAGASLTQAGANGRCPIDYVRSVIELESGFTQVSKSDRMQEWFCRLESAQQAQDLEDGTNQVSEAQPPRRL